MLSRVTTYRSRVLGGLVAVVALAGCSTTTSGSGQRGGSTMSTAGSSADFPAESLTAPASTPSVASPTETAPAPSTSTIHPAPSAPLRTATVHAGDGTTYVIKIWADVKNDTCFDHAYGQPMITFLTEHPCTGLQRVLGTTTVNGRPVAFAESALGFRSPPSDPYKYASEFSTLVRRDGTGNINDLLREGYRLPAGPTRVPYPDAFNCVGQDEGVTVWDAWYLDGPTPNNDKALVTMTEDIFLQF
ncbi:MAG: hypothetical protein QOG01_3833 [Pseudonocardiales bacterium]|nr:hypothetical protein [Pseudonocardiales bacterium]